MSHLRLLLWKNLLIQRRSIVWSALEFLLPLLFACILLILRQNVYSSKQPYREYESFDISGTRRDFSEMVDSETIATACFHPFRVYYTPLNNLTNKIMSYVDDSLQVSSVGMPSESLMQITILKEMDTLDLCSCTVYGGVVFEDGLDLHKEEVRYKIRLSNTPRNMHISQGGFSIRQASIFAVGLGWKTDALFAFPPQNGPRERNFSDGGKPGYWREGFLSLQHAVDKAIMAAWSNGTHQLPKHTVRLQRFAYPPYTDNGFTTVIQQHLPVVILLSFALSVVYISRSIVVDKELRLREFMRVMGLTYFNHSLAHFLINFLKLALISAIMTSFLCVSIGGQRILDKSDPTIVYFFLLVYSFSTVCYCFAVASFFNSGNVVAGCAGLVWCCLYWPYFFIQPRYSSIFRSTKLVTCLLTNSAMSFGVQLIGIFEGQNVGLQWHNLFHHGTMYNNLSMIEIIAMLLVDSGLCLLIACYVEAVQPMLIGSRSLWSLFTVSFYRNLLRSRASRIQAEVSSLPEENNYFEKSIQPVRIIVSINHLCKVYEKDSGGKTVALNDLNLDLYYGQITALLGHNGAGKSTAISIMTGLQSATAGRVTINGVDLRSDFKRVSRFIGYCPQYNPLFNELTVYEHLKFYCQLKQRPLIPTEVDRVIQFLNLDSKRDCRAATLSGGMKRKLCVAIALIGGSEVVLLDEPTTGMDPQARHDAWRLLLEEKQYRTILLTTHFMEEADLLGDRIAVLSNGTLQCCGTSFFLKRQFGDGYRLRVIFKNSLSTTSVEAQVDRLLNHIKAFVPDASLGSSLGTEALYILPAIKGTALQTLFFMLEDNQNSLDIDTFGLSVITMEEVFLKVTPASKRPEGAVSSNGSNSADLALRDVCRIGGVKLKLQQFYAIFAKRALDASRNCLLIFVQTFVPVLFVVVAILVNQTLPDNKKTPPLELNVDSYSNTIVGLYADKESATIGRIYESQFSAAHTVDWQKSPNFTAYVLEKIEELDQSVFDQMCIIAAAVWKEGDQQMLTAYFNNQPFHAMAASLNSIDNALFGLMANGSGGGNVPKITVINHPLPPTEMDSLVNWWETGISEFNIAFNLVFGFSFMVSFFIVYIIRERQCGAKHLQFLSDLSVGLFWMANFLWDFVAYMVTVVAILLTFVIFKVDVLVGAYRWMHVMLLMVLYGWANIWMMYFASFFFSSAAAGYVRASIFNLLSGLLTLVVITILLVLDLQEVHKALLWVFMVLFPNFCLGQAMSAYYFNFFLATTCEPLMPFCSFTPDAFCCRADTFTEDLLRWNHPGIGRYLFFLSLHGGLYCALVLLTDSGLCCPIGAQLLKLGKRCRRGAVRKWLQLKNSFDNARQQSLEDLMDVNNVSEPVETVGALAPNDDAVLEARQLRKCYGNFEAVRNISFQVGRGECFGLLGVNGAGKTTTFQMLCGQASITDGNAYIDGLSIRRQWSRAKALLGYCPQFDAVLENLTVTETLTLYARLHGIHWRSVRPLVENMIEMVDLAKHSSKRVAFLSGGSKRKLSLAIALIASPRVLLLDEPTSGVDPLSRRVVWRLLECVRRSGVSIVLTSHSMEECEALCGRLAVVVNGEVKCVGSPQQLKSKYGKGYLLIVKFKCEEFMIGFVRAMEQMFPETSVEEIHGVQMHCLIPFQASTWSKLFEALEGMAESHGIVDYMLSQPSLEQIFLTCAGV